MDAAELLRRGFSRETKIRRDERGRWFDDDVPIERPSIIRAFDQWVARAEDGRYCLSNSINWAYCEIEGAPVFVRGVSLDDGVWLSLSDGRSERLDPSTLRRDAAGHLFCTVRDGSLAARFDRNALSQLESNLDEDGDAMFLRLDAGAAPIPVVEDPIRTSDAV